MKQKGMEMAIQVFIILFVLLAVAVLVLQMVGEGFEGVGEELDRHRRTELERMQEDCAQLCRTADSAGTQLAMVNYCKAHFDEDSPFKSADFTNSGTIGDYDDTLLAGIGICEDAIYCSSLHECQVGTTRLTMSNCINIMCNYWENQVNLDFANEKITEFISPGRCFDGQDYHWYELEFGGEDPSCG